MALLRIGLLILLCGCPAVAAQDKPEQKEQPDRWEEAIRAFEDWDSRNSFPSDAVLFVGSSSIRLWPTHECFRDLPVINRGFGGSQISEVNAYVKRIVLPYAPKVIVFYAGDNDIASGKKSAERILPTTRRSRSWSMRACRRRGLSSSVSSPAGAAGRSGP
jgi:hypothetical protein